MERKLRQVLAGTFEVRELKGGNLLFVLKGRPPPTPGYGHDSHGEITITVRTSKRVRKPKP